MGFSPVGRNVTPSVDFLVDMLNAYRGISSNLSWHTAGLLIEHTIPGYAQSRMQISKQLGLEYRNGNFVIQSYLLCFDTNLLKKYLSFWLIKRVFGIY